MIRGKVRKSKGLYFILSEQEKHFKFAPWDIPQNSRGFFLHGDEFCNIKKNQAFGPDLSRNVDFLGISTNQFTALGTGIVPFLEHDDANRALMGSNMQRQSLPLIDKEMPLMETGIECSVVRESEATTIAKRSGKVIYSSMSKIVIKETFKSIKLVNRNLFLTKIATDNFFYERKSDNGIKTFRSTYFLGVSKRSNHSVFLRKNPIVKRGDWVKAGQVIADNRGTLKGNLSFGRNLLIGYLGWEGYNFEDAVIINERLVTEDILTSLHVKKYKTFFIVGGNKEVRILYLVLIIYFQKINCLEL